MTSPEWISYETFLERHGDDFAEWVDGRVVLLSPASNRHQELLGFLVSTLGIYVEAKGLGVVRPAPFQMKLGPDQPGREPDLIFVSEGHTHRLHENHLDGPADLAVEIVSPDSRDRDYHEKPIEYAHGGVTEYWIVDPLRNAVGFHLLGDDGRYELVPTPPSGVFHSRAIAGLWMRSAWLCEESIPRTLDVLREWQII